MDKKNGNGETPEVKESDLTSDDFWAYVIKVAKIVGKEFLIQPLTLWYCLKDGDTPLWAKSVIVSALLYFVMPIDAIPDPIPVIGFTDDVAAMAAAAAVVKDFIKSKHRKQAKETVNKLFSRKEKS